MAKAVVIAQTEAFIAARDQADHRQALVELAERLEWLAVAIQGLNEKRPKYERHGWAASVALVAAEVQRRATLVMAEIL